MFSQIMPWYSKYYRNLVNFVAQQNSFPKSHFSSLVIKQLDNSWKLKWVNTTILNNKIWLVDFDIISNFYDSFTGLYEKLTLLFDQLETAGSQNIGGFSDSLWAEHRAADLPVTNKEL